MNEKLQAIIEKLNKKDIQFLLHEIALETEHSFRRGFQQGSDWGTPEIALKLRFYTNKKKSPEVDPTRIQPLSMARSVEERLLIESDIFSELARSVNKS
tara:strand:+ start:178 stop:474 length:297 start_codon:yes stop_codon:yes gene_type:complete